MKTRQKIGGLAATVWALAFSVATAQRIQFASPSSNPTTTVSQSTAPVYTPPASNTSPYSTPTPAAAPTPSPAPAGSTFVAPNTTPGAAAAPGLAPTYTPPAGTQVAPSAIGPPGAAQPPVNNWDPYATPGCAPGSLMSQDPYLATTPSFGVGAGMASMQKFLQRIDFEYAWFIGHGERELGINDVGISATFAIPAFKNVETPFLITPGFAVHYWEGPVSLPPPPAPADLPPQTYDAYLDAAWNPWINANKIFGGELSFRVGVYSDFKRVTSDSVRFTGKGLAVLRLSPSMTLKGGIWYLDRVKVKLLPAGGICWTPNADVYFNILFPNPEIARRLSTVGNTEWWLYASGEYGGGTWTIKRNSGLEPPVSEDGRYDRFDYNDIRVAVGVRFKTLRQFSGYLEGGLSCSRELVYMSLEPPAYYPRNTFYLGAGMSY